MTEQWELCTMIQRGSLIRTWQKTIYTSTGVQKSGVGIKDFEKDICELLAEGWEPFNSLLFFDIANHPILLFRRRVS